VACVGKTLNFQKPLLGWFFVADFATWLAMAALVSQNRPFSPFATKMWQPWLLWQLLISIFPL
jgi:hypothetical protein